ncbi:MAG: hypothetical protein ABR595_09025, partial [Psychroflexus sp.]
MAKKKKPNTNKPPKAKKSFKIRVSKRNKIIFGSFLILFSIGLVIAFVSYFFNWQADQSTLADPLNRNDE